jgi:ABC-2 type transport system permease protein
VFKLLGANLKMLVRNKQALFWSLFFPVVFIIIFGLFFGKSNNMSGSISVIDKSNNEISRSIVKGLEDSKLFTIKDNTDLNTAKDQIQKGKLSAIVFIPQNFAVAGPQATNSVKVYYDPAYASSGNVLVTFVDKYLTGFDYQVQKVKPIYKVEADKVNNNKQFSYFDFVLVGILGLALMNGSIIGIAVGISRYREDKILKRIVSTPLKPWKFVSAEVFSRLIINLVQISLVLVVGVYVFNGHIYGNLIVVVLLALLGGILFQLIGFCIAAYAKTVDAAQGMAQAITIPMMFLAGIFFPIDSLPGWLSNIVKFLPLAPLLRMLRIVAIEAGSPFQSPSNILIVLGWILITLTISIYKFRLTEE